MSAPDLQRIYDVIAATWPPLSATGRGPWTIRDGGGGAGRISSRVSAVTADGPWEARDIAAAEAGCRAVGQVPLFMIREGEDDLDAALAGLGYGIKDPVNLYSARAADIAVEIPPVSAFEVWPPLARQEEIWAEGGIGSSRLAVMARCAGPKTTFFGRLDDQPGGTVYVGVDGDVAMLHALEIAPNFRRKGLARILTSACARFARTHGATYLTLVTTTENDAANALYRSLGFALVGHYHYRIHPEAL